MKDDAAREDPRNAGASPVPDPRGLEVRLAFLNRATEVLLGSRDSSETLQRLADLAVPQLGDWCAVDMVREDGALARLAVAHSDPAKVALARTLAERYPPHADQDQSIGVPRVIRTGEPELVPEIPPSLIEENVRDAEHLEIIRGLGLRSYMIVPLRLRGLTLGALTLVTAGSRRSFSHEDLAPAQELARVAALAIDNARLFERLAAALQREQEARSRAEDSERAFRAFIDNLPEVAWTARPDGHIDFFNRRFYDFTGARLEEVEGWGWQSLHDPEALPVVLERWRRSLTTGEPFEMELTLRGADGLPRWFLTRVSPMRDASGHVVRWFGINVDIDDIKAAHALATIVTAQSRDTQELIRELRAARDHALRRVAELEAELAGRTREP
jgi:PAS domain S-box-containing protein